MDEAEQAKANASCSLCCRVSKIQSMWSVVRVAITLWLGIPANTVKKEQFPRENSMCVYIYKVRRMGDANQSNRGPIFILYKQISKQTNLKQIIYIIWLLRGLKRISIQICLIQSVSYHQSLIFGE